MLILTGRINNDSYNLLVEEISKRMVIENTWYLNPISKKTEEKKYVQIIQSSRHGIRRISLIHQCRM